MSIIVAIDTDSESAALALVDKLSATDCRIKIGKELFTRAGPGIVTAIEKRGFDVFLDLKFHDIPNTTSQAVLAAADLGVWMVNVHASGGRTMLQTTADKLKVGHYHTLLTAVTVLTSMTAADLHEVGVHSSTEEQVLRLATLTQQCGLHGVVCSANEAAMLRQALGTQFLLVTPGIRPPNAATDDQHRISSPQAAMLNGASHLVIGRPITQAADPQQALMSIIASL